MNFSELHSHLKGLQKRAQVSAYQQKTEWSCSAATLKAALLHHGHDFSEEELIKAIGARKGCGAETTDIMNGAKKLGFDAYEGSFKNLEDAKETLRKGIPIIADVQSFNYPGKGHYIVIAGFKPGKGYIVMDPNTKGKTAIDNWRLMSAEELEEKWWDRAMAPPHELMPKWGVMVKPKSKEKKANGDMLQYFSDNPKKLKEYNERQAKKKKACLSKSASPKHPTAQERFYTGTKKKESGLADHWAVPKPFSADNFRKSPIGKTIGMTQKNAQGDTLGWGAMRRAKGESASAKPSFFGKSAEAGFIDELCKIANAGTTMEAISIGAKAGGLINGARHASNTNEPDRFSRVVKGVATGALVGALLALGMQRNAVGKKTFGGKL